MSISQQEFQAFSAFGLSRLASGNQQVTLEDLVVEWESLRERDDINAAIAAGLADMSAGGHRDAGEALQSLRFKHGLVGE